MYLFKYSVSSNAKDDSIFNIVIFDFPVFSGVTKYIAS